MDNPAFMERYAYHSITITVIEFVNLYPLFPMLANQIEQHSEDFNEVPKR